MFGRVLGPLEVSIDGKVLPIGRNRQLTVLALLMLDANHPVTVSRLVEGVWASAPPRTAEDQIQTCVWRLRRSLHLAGAPQDVIETTNFGYSFRIDETDLDAHLFEQSVREARTAAAKGACEKAIARYRRALGLFRGKVLEEIPSPLVEISAVQWEERRLAVLEECIDQQLRAGEYHDVVSELTGLVAQHPLRERMRAQLMVALRRCDRRAEALAVYRDGRAVLVENLGLEPGPGLRELHREILAD
jgi:DNA-binding SARP family transcriptional activator